jgi:hypothetical protein
MKKRLYICIDLALRFWWRLHGILRFTCAIERLMSFLYHMNTASSFDENFFNQKYATIECSRVIYCMVAFGLRQKGHVEPDFQGHNPVIGCGPTLG